MKNKYTYETISNDFGTVIKRTDESGAECFIPLDESNPDYQAYLNPDQEAQSL